MSQTLRYLLALIALSLIAPTNAIGQHTQHTTHAPSSDATPFTVGAMPEMNLVDQRGDMRSVQEIFGGDGLLAVNFVFTRCTTICPPMGAVFARLQQESADRGLDVRFVSVSIDPANDTPARLASWTEKFVDETAGGPDWTLLTGEVADVDLLLRHFGVWSALKEDHAPLMVLGRPGQGRPGQGEWRRTSGLASPSVLADHLQDLDEVRMAEAHQEPPSHPYLPDIELMDQTGKTVRFYSDLVAGKTVVINAFFSACTGSCPVTHRALRAVQDTLGDRLGRDALLLSITVDPENDTPEKLSSYAEAFGARPGWHFLSGDPDAVEGVLRKLGQYVEQREAHQNVLLVGNDRTGLWKKAFALAPTPQVIEVVQSVLDDDGPAASPDSSDGHAHGGAE